MGGVPSVLNKVPTGGESRGRMCHPRKSAHVCLPSSQAFLPSRFCSLTVYQKPRARPILFCE